jgi:O-antigen biosynthesis protein
LPLQQIAKTAQTGNSLASLCDALDVGDELFLKPERLVSPDAWVGHLPFAMWLVKAMRPAVVVELGTHTGNSYSAFCQSIAAHRLDTSAFAVDTWRGDEHAGHYDERIHTEWKSFHDARWSRFSKLLRMTFDEALPQFADGSVDVLHIDGLHTYEAVRHDFETWLPKLSQHAVVLFHDTQVRRGDFGVWKFWAEISSRYPHFEFLHSHGLGVLGVGGVRSKSVQALFDSNPDPVAKDHIRDLYSVRYDGLLNAILLGEAQTQIAATFAEIARLQTAATVEAARFQQLIDDERMRHTSSLANMTLQHDDAVAEIARTQAASVTETAKFQQIIDDEQTKHANEIAEIIRQRDNAVAEIARMQAIPETERVQQLLKKRDDNIAELNAHITQLRLAELKR